MAKRSGGAKITVGFGPKKLRIGGKVISLDVQWAHGQQAHRLAGVGIGLIQPPRVVMDATPRPWSARAPVELPEPIGIILWRAISAQQLAASNYAMAREMVEEGSAPDLIATVRHRAAEHFVWSRALVDVLEDRARFDGPDKIVMGASPQIKGSPSSYSRSGGEPSK